MILKKKIIGQEVRCFNVIEDTKSRKYGQPCKRLLCKTNDHGEVAGEIKCSACGALYEIYNGFIILKSLKKEVM